jgi:hypothetical protein
MRGLDQRLWDAIESVDLVTALAAYSDGALPEIMMFDTDLLPLDHENCVSFVHIYEEMDPCAPFPSLLMLAAKGGTLAFVEWLRSVVCDPRFIGPNTTFSDGYGGGSYTAFHMSANAAIASCLLEHGADPNDIYKIDSYENYSWQEMSWSNCGGGGDYERVCVRHGGDVNRVLQWRGYQADDRLCEAYWPKAVRSGDVDWARELRFLLTRGH